MSSCCDYVVVFVGIFVVVVLLSAFAVLLCGVALVVIEHERLSVPNQKF
jgi:hypothetical protein